MYYEYTNNGMCCYYVPPGRWYVDAQSLDDYLALGLDAIVGGKRWETS